MRVLPTLVIALLVLAPVPARAAEGDPDEAEAAFQDAFGDLYKKAVATKDIRDDIALAEQILDAANAAAKQPRFFALLCRKAFELTRKSAEGHATAIRAMELLASKDPSQAVACLTDIVAMRQAALAGARADARKEVAEALVASLLDLADAKAAAGDLAGALTICRQAKALATGNAIGDKNALDARLKDLGERQATAAETTRLQGLLEKDPANADARMKLVHLYLVQLDNPAEAAKYVNDSVDEATRKYVPAAAKPATEAPELACLELAKWYAGLAAGTTGVPKAAMLRRTVSYYESYLQRHAGDDTAKAAAQIAMKRAQDDLAKLDAAGIRTTTATPGFSSAGGGIRPLNLKLPQKVGLVKTYEGHNSQVIALAVSPDGKRLASASSDGTIRLWETETAKVLWTIPRQVSFLRFSENGKFLTGLGLRAYRFDLEAQKEGAETRGVVIPYMHIPTILPSGQIVAYLRADSDKLTLSVFDIEGKKSVRDILTKLTQANTVITGVDVAPDGKTALAFSMVDGKPCIPLFDLSTGAEIRTLGQETIGRLSRAQFSRDGKFVMGCGQLNSKPSIILWDTKTGKATGQIEGYAEARLLPDGKRVAGITDDKIDILDLATRKVIQTVKRTDDARRGGHGDHADRLAFTADGRYLFCSIIETGAKTFPIWAVGIQP